MFYFCITTQPLLVVLSVLQNYKYYSQYRNYEKYHNHTGGERGKGYTQKMGRKGDTYNEIIKRLIKRSEYIEFMEEQYRILNGEKEWTSIDEI